MSQDELPEAVTLDALDLLREECSQLSDHVHATLRKLYDLHTELSNPNLHGLPVHLPFQIEQWDRYGHIRYVVSASSNVTIARASFDAAVKNYPSYQWTLSQGMMLMGKHEPKLGEST